MEIERHQMASNGAEFQIQGDTLRVSGELRHTELALLEEALRRLIDGGSSPLTVDFTDTAFITGSCVQPIALAMTWAKQRGSPMTVLASRQVFHILRLARVDRLGTVKPTCEVPGVAVERPSPENGSSESQRTNERARRERRMTARERKRRSPERSGDCEK